MRTESVVADWQRYMSLRAIGKRHGISHESVRKIVAGAVRGPRPETDWPQIMARRVRMVGECLEWKSGAKKRYGSLRVMGRRVYAHRWAWELANGPIPEGMVVCHHCDNPPCVNLAHLFIGTVADNIRDRDAKGRGRSGPRTRSTRCRRGLHLMSESAITWADGERRCGECFRAYRRGKR